MKMKYFIYTFLVFYFYDAYAVDTIRIRASQSEFDAIPNTDRKIRNAVRSKSMELECGTDEVLCLVDNGSTINAALIGEHFPQYADLVESTPASEGGAFATAAGGDKLFNNGRCMIQGQAQDQAKA